MNLKQTMARIEAKIKQKSYSESVPNDKEESRNLCENSVTKSNSLARGYYRFNLTEKRVMEALISQLNPQSKMLSQLQVLELKATDYAKTFNVSKKNAYEQIESAVHSLMHRVFSVSRGNDREEFTLMSNAKYSSGDGKIICSFNSYVTPDLIGLKNKFLKYPLEVAVNFKSSYTWRIYEILVSWAKDPKVTYGVLAGWCTIEIKEFRQMLGIPKSYKFNDIKRRVLELSQKELKDNAKIEFDVEYIKTGRKITHLKFTFAEIIPE